MQNRLSTLARLALLLALPLAACGDDKDPTGAGSVQGSYTLTTVNGKAVPATVFEEQEGDFLVRVDIQSGALVLDNGKFTATMVVEAFVNGEPIDAGTEPVEGTGTYTVSGNKITLKTTDPETKETTTTVGTISSGTITISETVEGETWTFVYKK